MKASARPDRPLDALERVVIGSVAVTAIAVGEAAPDLSLVQWRVLVILADADGMPVSELARRLRGRLPATSRVVGRLRRRGLVEARKDQADARVTTLYLTPTGRELWARVVERRRLALAEASARAMKGASDSAFLERLAAALESLS